MAFLVSKESLENIIDYMVIAACELDEISNKDKEKMIEHILEVEFGCNQQEDGDLSI